MAANLRVPLALPDWVELNRRTAQMSTELEGWREQYEVNTASYHPWKACSLIMRGDLTIVDGFNIATVTNPLTGFYDVTLDQQTIEGVDITERIIPVLAVDAPGAEQGVYVGFAGETATDVITINVREFYLQGVNLRIQDYDLGPAETLWFMGLLNYRHPGAESLPP